MAANRGAYINLDRSSDRRARIEAHLARLDLGDRYQRIAAVDGATLSRRTPLKPGELGIFASHIAALEVAAASEGAFHVAEDDVLIAPQFAPAVEAFDKASLLGRCDLLLTEMMLPPNIQFLKDLKAKFDAAMAEREPARFIARLQVIDLAGSNFAGATSYLTRPAGAAKALALAKKEFAAGPTLPFDIFLRREVQAGRLRMACVVPFLTSFDLDSLAESTAGRSDELESVTLMALLRRAFFVGEGVEGAPRRLLDQLATSLEGPQPDVHRRFLGDVLGLVLSSRFRMF